MHEKEEWEQKLNPIIVEKYWKEWWLIIMCSNNSKFWVKLCVRVAVVIIKYSINSIANAFSSV